MSPRFVAAVLAAAVLTGCADSGDTPLTAPEFTKSASPTTTTACNYTTVRSFARALFGNNSPGFALAEQLSSQTPGSAAATNLGFDIFKAIATLRGTAGLTATQISNAANLTVQVIPCQNVTVTGGNTVAIFSQALGATGAYQVRGGTSTAGAADASTPVLALNRRACRHRVTISPPGWAGGRCFMASPSLPSPAASSGAAAGLSGTVAFDWSLVHSAAVALPRPTKGIFSLCVISEDDAALAQLRVQKIAQILEVATPVPGLECPEALASAEPRTFGDRLMAMATRLLAPTPLNAAAVALRTSGKPTGGAGSFSPFQVGNPLRSASVSPAVRRTGRRACRFRACLWRPSRCGPVGTPARRGRAC